MTHIDSNTNHIYITRGDDLDFDFNVSTGNDVYQFQVGDKIRMGIYNQRKMSNDACLIKEFEIKEVADSYHIHISSEEMKLGNLINMPKDYWYEIILNDTLTVVGYDKNGAAILTLFPEGSDIMKDINKGDE